MAFKNLENRFNENVNKLYGGAKSKFDNGIASSGKADAPLIVREPGDGQVGIKLEGRSLPVVSAAQDLKRLTLFQLSKPGLLFLAKQQLLQTGNTFEFTRAVNPAFVVANAIPFLHIKRNLRPLAELIAKTDTSYANVRTMGQMQFGTYNTLKSKNVLPQLLGNSSTDKKSRLGTALKSALLGPLKSLKDTVTGTLSAISPFQRRNVGEQGGIKIGPATDKWNENSWKLSRPELVTYIPTIQSQLLAGQVKLANAQKDTQAFTTIATTDRYADVNNPVLIDAKKDIIKYIAYFNPADSIKSSEDSKANSGDPRSVKAKRVAQGGNLPDNKKISYIKDPSNKERSSGRSDAQEAYKPINHKFPDAINVSFAMGKQQAIQFRAFIKDLNQTATPEYKAYQYIGRMEKFINYVGVQREISFKLGVIAFSKDELKAVWRRINYLTGLVFPYGFNKGIMQPNITRLTIGNVYVDQPGYVTGLSTNFTELSESWDIDAGTQVPIAAQMDIKFILIEKATRIADSPFYGITDGGINADNTLGKPMSGFKNSLTPPIPPTTTPIKQEIAARKSEDQILQEACDEAIAILSRPGASIDDLIAQGYPIDRSGRCIQR